jgi:RNA polymerase sigma factor (sigma-70 family)
LRATFEAHFDMVQDSVLTEQSLADRIRRGDPAAEAEFVERYYRRVLLMAQVRTGDRQVALDLAQEAMIGLLRALREGRVNSHQHVAGYVHGTARNLINNHFRGRTKTEGVTFDLEAAHGDPEQMAAERERLELVERALDQMRPDDREILRMTLVEGLKSGEIADRLGIASEVVRKRKSRAVGRLQKAVNQVSRSQAPNHLKSEDR